MDRLDMVTVAADATEVLEVTPFVKVRGGHSGLDKEALHLGREKAPARLADVLLEAFRRIGK